MANIQWVEGSSGSAELLVGANNELFQDVLNRPLKQIMSLSGTDPEGDFEGFALAGAGGVSSSYALTASFALNGGGSSISLPIVAGTYSSGSGAILNPGGNVISASYALTASFALNGGGGGSGSSISASYALTASYAVTSSFAQAVGIVNAGQIIGVSGSVINPNLVISASYATTASYATLAQNVLGSITSASYAITSSYATVAQNVLGTITSASYALTASYANSASNATRAISASWAPSPGGSSNGVFGGNFSGSFSGSVSITGSALLTGSLLGSASYATNAGAANTATTASFVVSASYAPVVTRNSNVVFEFGDGVNAPVSGAISGEFVLDFPGTIIKSTIIGDMQGSGVVDISTAPFANPPVYSSIAASAKPTLSSQTAVQDSTLTGWTGSFASGTIFKAGLVSISTCKKITVTLTIARN